ncbi:hypothetical protein K227x_11830 [Rubripirellula lacrimiformis]|uniref:Uncharacterized protein n=1 Tax=Rubripirellula lacrimiformis TaxID=1930273 RepID=A0A517N6Q6_9BACT|nr:protein-disulfide isomerase [Rubripirellula lacrimiformis]QDT02805.1 hypothetical protein K227x_11830 [Rubripirellula lacrimiformis]
MTVDTYAICPCGSGKKIKFCKCKDSVHELDEVMNMIEGGQVVPSLDRLSSILAENPDAAWALAVRGRLLLDLREYDSLAENAERFIRLQPSNPLALTQFAAALLFKGQPEKATAKMLEALTESGRDVDAFVLDVSSVLAYSLAQGGLFLTARVYATLAMMASGYQGGQTAMTVLRQLNSAPSISQLMKAVPEPIQRPEDAEWGERFDEASTLLRSNKVILAESKFESLRRSVPQQPAILLGLLTCAIWRGDADAQSDLLKKLSTCESLDFEQRARFLAMSALAKPGAPDASVETLTLSADIDQADEVEMALMSNARFVALPADLLQGMRTSEDDVPPKSGFQILDRDKPESLDKLPAVDDVPEAIAMVFVYGRQTDRAARIEAVEVRRDIVDEVRSRIDAEVSGLTWTENQGDPLPLLVACQPAIAMLRFQAKPAEAEKLQNELTETRMADAILSLKLPLLGGSSLRDLVGDESKLLERTAVVRLVQQFDAIVSKSESVVASVIEQAGLKAPDPIKPSDDDIESVANEDLNLVDPSGLNSESLIYLLQRAQQVSATPATRRLAGRLIDAELTEEQQPAKLLAYMSLVNAAENSSEALELLEKAKEFAVSKGIPTSNLLLSEVGLRLSAGDGPGFQSTLQKLTTEYGNEPEVMARLQQLLMQYGLINPDGSPRGGGPPPGPQGGGGSQGGLWTPDGGGAPAGPAPEEGGGGGSKLWVPGMD